LRAAATRRSARSWTTRRPSKSASRHSRTIGRLRTDPARIPVFLRGVKFFRGRCIACTCSSRAVLQCLGTNARR
jgi:hypothetical protein